MKTSNKVLLILGLVLLASPLLFLSFYVKAHTEPYNPMGYIKFEEKAAGMISVPTKSFNNIVVKGKKLNAVFTYKIFNSKQFGVKIPEALKGITSVNVNDKGELEIIVNHQFQNHPEIEICIFAPIKISLTLNNIEDERNIYANSYCLDVAADNCKNLYVASNSVSDSQQVSILSKNSNIRINLGTLRKLNVEAKGNTIISNDNDYDTLRVNTLQLNIQDKSTFSVKNIVANSIVGFVAENANIIGVDRSAVKKQ